MGFINVIGEFSFRVLSTIEEIANVCGNKITKNMLIITKAMNIIKKVQNKLEIISGKKAKVVINSSPRSFVK